MPLLIARSLRDRAGILTSGGTLRSVLNPSNRVPLLPLGKQLDHDQPCNESAAEGLAIFGLAATFITQIVAICVLARTFKRPPSRPVLGPFNNLQPASNLNHGSFRLVHTSVYSIAAFATLPSQRKGLAPPTTYDRRLRHVSATWLPEIERMDTPFKPSYLCCRLG